MSGHPFINSALYDPMNGKDHISPSSASNGTDLLLHREESYKASNADHRFCGPRTFRRVTGRSNSRARVGRYPDTVHDQTATFLSLLGADTGVLAVARPSPIFRAAGQPGPDRVKVDVLDLLVVFLDGAQGAVEEPGLPPRVARTTASVVRGFFKRRTADRKNGGPRYGLHGQRDRGRMQRRANRVPVVREEDPSRQVERM